MTLLEWFLCFFTYSFMGWVYESLVCSVDEKKLVNRRFLNGPICPVYGFGALVCILFLYQRIENVFVLFLAGIFLTCTVEYITAVLLEKLFHARWWDYSTYRFNLHGHVSLLGAIVFGTLSVLLILYIHPPVATLIAQLSDRMQVVLSLILLSLVLLDLYVTVRHLLRLNNRLKDIQTAINFFLSQYTKRVGELKGAVLDKFEESEFYNDQIRTLFHLDRIQNTRIIRAFPNMRSFKYNDAFQKLKKLLGFVKKNNHGLCVIIRERVLLYLMH
ncbi:putative ABC transporter permease [Desulforamulus ruminis]|uniref:ABC-transporter type IV n=1 Tax=Desulforamulus ruminis (strain ATCC 23193 / DSM 2154 / NCIMB 8452 / DL) TaxID=696281 RepID=F6DV58_DESRL|nr:putative ABC transporter permease [Desulforamulus ruminis]AEG59124.1 protein of unknown function DUF1113 [Desulforamulus ruminis DSM 2154]